MIAVGEEYLRIISWNFVASGLIFVASSMFQAMGNTMPSLIASAVRISLIVVPAIALARLPGFQLHWIWYLVGRRGVRAADAEHAAAQPRIQAPAGVRCGARQGGVAERSDAGWETQVARVDPASHQAQRGRAVPTALAEL